jgi:hypothetical protein
MKQILLITLFNFRYNCFVNVFKLKLLVFSHVLNCKCQFSYIHECINKDFDSMLIRPPNIVTLTIKFWLIAAGTVRSTTVVWRSSRKQPRSTIVGPLSVVAMCDRRWRNCFNHGNETGAPCGRQQNTEYFVFKHSISEATVFMNFNSSILILILILS